MNDYHNDALLDAVVFCIGYGCEADELLNSSVAAFGRIYGSIKRIEAYKAIQLASSLRMSPNADAEGYTKYIQDLSRWLHSIERQTIVEPIKKDIKVTGARAFMNDFKDKIRG